MDLGNDSALSARYASEHLCATNETQSDSARAGVLQRLRTCKSTRELLSHDIQYLVDHGYTASLLSSSGIPWSKMQRKYGAEALLNMGFTWEHMRSMGIEADEACAIGMDRLGITADELMEVRPSIAQIASMQVPIDRLKQLGFTLEKFIALGLSMSNMRRFGYDLRSWKMTYDLTKKDWDSLGFIDVDSAKKHGWCPTEMHSVGVYGDCIDVSSSASAAVPSTKWQF